VSTATHRAQSDRFGRAWRGFRRWRRSRPFWGGLFTVLAGAEILSTTKVSLAGLTLQMGPTGFLSWLIPTILVTCGLLMWFTPAQRIFYAVVAAVTAVYSLIGVNLGGFFIGMLLGMVGSALGFAWIPTKRGGVAVAPAADESDQPAGDDEAEDEPALVDELLPARQQEDEATGPLTDTLPQPRNPLREPAPAEPGSGSVSDTQVLPAVEPDGAPSRSMARDPKTYVVTLLLLSLAAAGVATVDGASPVQAAPACPTPSSSPARPSTPAPTSANPSSSASAEPEESDGNLLTDIIDGIGDLLTGDDEESEPPATEPGGDAAAAQPSPTASAVRVDPSATPSATPSRTPTSQPTATATASPTGTGGPDPGCVTPKPTKPAQVEPGKPLPKLAADPSMPKVSATPAKLTGTKVVMSNLRFAGVEPLHTEKGEMRALKFTMSKAVTDDFALLVAGPSGGSLLSETDTLTIDGDVTFYATRFVGRFLGIKVTLTPDLPFPDGIPVTLPVDVTFTEPQIDLAFISCDTLTGQPNLKQTLR
jgi:hypothetical protein